MAMKTFCDCCGNEIDDANGLSELTGIPVSSHDRKTMNVTVQATLANQYGDGNYDVCAPCVIDAVGRRDPRPQAEQTPSLSSSLSVVERYLGDGSMSRPVLSGLIESASRHKDFRELIAKYNQQD